MSYVHTMATEDPEINIDQLRQWVDRERIVQDAQSPFPAQAMAAALDRNKLPVAGDVLLALHREHGHVDGPGLQVGVQIRRYGPTPEDSNRGVDGGRGGGPGRVNVLGDQADQDVFDFTQVGDTAS